MNGYFISLPILGVGFKLLLWWMSPFEFRWVFLIEGAISGLGVATGLYLVGRICASQQDNREFNPDAWWIKSLPYVCGIVAVVVGKICMKILCSTTLLDCTYKVRK